MVGVRADCSDQFSCRFALFAYWDWKFSLQGGVWAGVVGWWVGWLVGWLVGGDMWSWYNRECVQKGPSLEGRAVSMFSWYPVKYGIRARCISLCWGGGGGGELSVFFFLFLVFFLFAESS